MKRHIIGALIILAFGGMGFYIWYALVLTDSLKYLSLATLFVLAWTSAHLLEDPFVDKKGVVLIAIALELAALVGSLYMQFPHTDPETVSFQSPYDADF